MLPSYKNVRMPSWVKLPLNLEDCTLAGVITHGVCLEQAAWLWSLEGGSMSLLALKCENLAMENKVGQDREPAQQPSFYLPRHTRCIDSPCRVEQKRSHDVSAGTLLNLDPKGAPLHCSDFLHLLRASVSLSTKWAH